MIKKVLLFSIFTTVILFGNLQAQRKVLFRYNADYAPESNLQTPVSLTNVSVNSRTDDSEEIARGSDGWGYNERKTAYFYTDSSAIVTNDNISMSVFGTISVSGELWIKFFPKDGMVFSWNDSSSAHGIKLYIENSRLVLSVRLLNEEYLLSMSREADFLSWQRVEWQCKVTADSIEQVLIINGYEKVMQKSPLRAAIGFVVLNAPLSLGYSALDTANTPSFGGEIYASVLRNYIPEKLFNESPLPLDGGPYLGMVGYHDYMPGSTEEQMDLRITENDTEIMSAFFLPYLNDDFIPQGITNTFEDENYSGERGMIYISMYNKTVDGVTGLKRSIIVEIDPDSGFVRRCFRLGGIMKTGHNGGIAFKNNSIYVATGSKVEVYHLPDYSGDGKTKYQDLTTDGSNLYYVRSKASFMTYYQDSVWIGDYRTDSDSDRPYLYGYPLDESGKILTSENPKIYRLPTYAQGVAWRVIGGTRYLFISKTGESSGSRIYRCRLNDLSIYNPPAVDTMFTVPSGGEDLSFDQDGNLLNVSESGAKYFQKGASSWLTFYPFVYKISKDVLSENIKETEFVPPVIINEILVDPDTDPVKGDANKDGVRSYWEDEFVELLNISNIPYDLSGYKLGDDERFSFTFPEGYILPANQFVVVFGGGDVSNVTGYDPDTLKTKVFSSGDSIGNGLSNSGDYVILVSPDGKLDMYLAYGSQANTGHPQSDNINGVYWEIDESTLAVADNNNSITRNPDGEYKKEDNFVEHLSVSDVPFSPGTTIDGKDEIVSVFEKDNSIIPKDSQIKMNYPNPFNQSTVIAFELNNDYLLDIAVFDLLGRKVKSYKKERFTKGYHRKLWDGNDDSGKALPSGIYFIEIKSAQFTLHHKLMLVR